MKQPFYHGDTRTARLIAEALSWEGTPFHPHGRIKGVGVDCVQLLAAVYIETGFLEDFAPGRYSMDGGHHRQSSRVVEWIDASGRFDGLPVDLPGLRTGDLLVFRMRRVGHHVGLFLRGHVFVHALAGHGVQAATLEDSTYLKLWAGTYRPMEETIT